MLYVEDDPSIRAGVERALTSYGYRVVACGSAEAALQRLPELADDLAALATDLMLPGISGLELWRRASAVVPGLPVLFMSGYAELSMRDELVRGELRVLQKPLDGRGVATALRAVIDQARGEAPAASAAPGRVGGADAAAAASGPAAAPGSSSPLILVADDEDLVRRTVATILEDCGYRVVTACDGVEAIEQVERHGDDLAVVLLDMSMPRKRGLEVVDELARRGVTVPVIASSGLGSAAIDAAVAAGRLAGFVAKPYAFEELLAAIEAARARPRPGAVAAAETGADPVDDPAPAV
ncbi:MAG: response regulator [Kofleriaceae bacterium]|nr:response regulator [Kofleriaceae bacterium]